MGKSGDPRKQNRGPELHKDKRASPEELQAARLSMEVTNRFPPVLIGTLTAFDAGVIDFPFPGGKALEVTGVCGPLHVKLRVDPEFAELICDEIMQAATRARTNIVPAAPGDVDHVAEQAGQLDKARAEAAGLVLP